MISKVIAWYNAGMITKAEAEKALERYKQITEGKQYVGFKHNVFAWSYNRRTSCGV